MNRFPSAAMLVLSVLALIVAASSAFAASPSLCVNPGGTGGCLPTVQAAVDASPKRKKVTILIGAGVYNEHVIIPPRKNLSFVGGAPLPEGTVISGVTVPPSAGSTITVQRGAKLLLQTLTITGGNALQGAGINSMGALNIVDSIVSGNTAAGGGSGLGGGIYFGGTVMKISKSRVDANQADVGGGIYLRRGVANVNDTQVATNAANSSAGGIALGGGLLKGLNLYIAGNTTGGQGGGIALKNGKLKTGNTTLAGNNALGQGGGLAILGKGTAFLNNSTVSGNLAQDAGGILNGGNSKQAIKIANTLLAGNSTIPVIGGVNQDCAGAIRSLGYNLVQTVSTACSLSSAKGDQTGANPNLNGFSCDPLNIVCVETFPSGSFATSGGNPATPNGVGNHCLPTDALGTARSKGACDIGAYQLP